MKRKRERKRDVETSIVVGFFGCEPGVGVTFLVLAMATYFSQFLGIQTTVMECCGQDRLIHLEGRLKRVVRCGENHFRIDQVDYYANAGEELVAEQICSNRGAILLDLGHNYLTAKPYLMRCTRKVLLVNTMPWKVSTYEEFREAFETVEKKIKWDVTGTFAWNETERNKIMRDKVDLLQIPFIPNPFQITFQECQILRKVMNQSIMR